jgi:hypothetical protein
MAAKKQLTPAEVKAAKQKKIAIGGAVLLVAILAFEVPKMMKMMSSKPPAASATPAATTPSATPAAPTGATPAAATPSAPTGAAGVDGLVVNADLSPTPLEGQLPALTATFTSKDPFRQQNVAPAASDSGTTPDTAAAGAKKAAGSIVPDNGSSSGGTGDTTTTPGATTPAAPAGKPVSAVISVNGVDSPVGVGNDFPSEAPLFTLKSLTAKTAQIAIAGGSLSSGAGTITLHLNVPLTLMNTADGTRYKLVLVSTSSTAVAATTPSAPATTTSTTATTPTG